MRIIIVRLITLLIVWTGYLSTAVSERLSNATWKWRIKVIDAYRYCAVCRHYEETLTLARFTIRKRWYHLRGIRVCADCQHDSQFDGYEVDWPYLQY